MGPKRSSGRIIGHGNLVEAKAMLKKAGDTMAMSQRMVFHFNRFFFSAFFIFVVPLGCFFVTFVTFYKKRLASNCLTQSLAYV
jgi:hypothetical protein